MYVSEHDSVQTVFPTVIKFDSYVIDYHRKNTTDILGESANGFSASFQQFSAHIEVTDNYNFFIGNYIFSQKEI